MTQASIYSWLKQERIDRGESPGLSTEGQMELAAAKRRIRQMESELAVSRRLNKVFLEQNLPPRALAREGVHSGPVSGCYSDGGFLSRILPSMA